MTVCNWQDTVKNEVMQKADLDDYLGKFLNNRYLIRELIGKGGMGKVYLAEDAAKGGIPVAVKILSLSLANQQMSQRFAREIFIGAQLGRKSKHIARVLSYGITEDKIPFYVMEYLQGTNLKTVIKSQSLNLSKILEIIHQICLGLQCAHEGIKFKGEIYPVLHRDIKPENIFILEDTKQGESHKSAASISGEIVKILDFGIAKFLTERAGMTLTESFIGSLPYCSPEHMEGRKLVDVRSDIYSLGVLMFEMLTGKHPFNMKDNSFGNWYQAHRFQVPPKFQEVNPNIHIPRELQELVMKCLAKEVKNRPQNIEKVLETLEKIKQQQNGQFLKTVSSKVKNISHIPNNISKNISNTSSVQLVPITSISEKICLQKIWPANKPKALICFPNIMHSTHGNIPTLWAMLPKKEIDSFAKQINTSEFIVPKNNLHPLLLWINVLSDDKLNLTRWLSYFLDMKDANGQKILQALANTGYYHILLFAIENSQKCEKVITLNLSASQRQTLNDWLESCEKINPVAPLHESKNILRIQYEKMKPEIISRLVAIEKQQRITLRELLDKTFSKVLSFMSRPII
ncbi:serine/threonine-protein kinase [Calothrix sp. UHCC 0171]|uniref:serine/threonine protein kinase n=1 Tax=Calothrix sp. UHCC 0171 TaxID=3110245 RepID=UPI002B20B82B|nr:serine/threonine-protein kinase [Calothrix sp. UHCC 0171]MEA5573141.1 serine/threonine-protein kinase [Calothrix sp. UHCC 0171]